MVGYLPVQALRIAESVKLQCRRAGLLLVQMPALDKGAGSSIPNPLSLPDNPYLIGAWRHFAEKQRGQVESTALYFPFAARAAL